MCGVVVDLIDIDHDGHAGFARPPGGLDCRGRVAAVQVKDAAAGDHLAAQLPGGIIQFRIAMPEDGAFADAIFKEDNRDLAHGSFDYANELNVEILRMEACQLSLPPIVRAHRTDVSSLQTKLRAGRKRSRHLSAGFHANFLDVNLTVWFRKSRHDADRVHGI